MTGGATDPTTLRARVEALADELVALRRDLHAHPELARAEVRTTRVVRERLQAAGLTPRVLPGGTGLVCDIGAADAPAHRVVGLRADLDALPVPDEKDVPYRSTVPGVCHACGHDVHTVALLGAGLVLADLAALGELPGRVRLLFQPAEEVMPGGALDVLQAGGADGLDSVFALHCDPHVEVGRIGLREGAITAASDRLLVRMGGPGGHTARPHLTADLVFALASVAAQLPALLSRRVDPRAGMSVVWGRIRAGAAGNAIPRAGEVEGTVRCLDDGAWQAAPELVTGLVHELAAPFGVTVEVDYTRGVPPVVNAPASTRLLAAAAHRVLGPDAVVPTEQSLGGEDFAWYLTRVPGALARLGVRRPPEQGAGGPAGDVPGDLPKDLHRGDFDVDEAALVTGALVLAQIGLSALGVFAAQTPA